MYRFSFVAHNCIIQSAYTYGVRVPHSPDSHGVDESLQRVPKLFHCAAIRHMDKQQRCSATRTTGLVILACDISNIGILAGHCFEAKNLPRRTRGYGSDCSREWLIIVMKLSGTALLRTISPNISTLWLLCMVVL